jgi:hypothetical protein
MEFTCPCCQKIVTEAKLSNTIQLLKSNDCEYEATDEFPSTFALPYSKWACDACLENKKSVLADINKQNYSFLVEATRRPFYLAYTPWESVCRRCQKTFEVSIEQQQRSYEVLKMPMRIVPTHCLACEEQLLISKKALTSATAQKPMTKRRLIKHIAAARKNNDLEKMQRYQLRLEKMKVELVEQAQKQIAELTQNGEHEPTDVGTALQLIEFYQVLDDRANLKKWNKRLKYLKWEWRNKNIKPTLDPKSVVPKKQKKAAKAHVKDTPVNVESQPVLEPTPLNIPVKDTPVLETTPIQAKDTPVKKAKKIQKPVLKPTPLKEPVKDTPIELRPVLEPTPIPVKVKDTLVEPPPVLEKTAIPVKVKDTPIEPPPILEPTPIPVKVKDTLVEPPPIIETTPIQVNEEPIKKAKKKRIVKSVMEPQRLKFKSDSTEDDS